MNTDSSSTQTTEHTFCLRVGQLDLGHQMKQMGGLISFFGTREYHVVWHGGGDDDDVNRRDTVNTSPNNYKQLE